MDQGVIRSLKAQYRKNVVRGIIGSVERKKTLQNVFYATSNTNAISSLVCSNDENCFE